MTAQMDAAVTAARVKATRYGHDLHPFVLANQYQASSGCRACGATLAIRINPDTAETVSNGTALCNKCEGVRT